jgi:ribokinase
MQKTKFDVVTIGGATRDFFISSDKARVVNNKKSLKERKLLAFELGAKHYIEDLHSFLGGGACNTAIGFSKLKLKTAIKICIGVYEEGRWIKRTLKKEKVNTSLIKSTKEEPSGLSFIIIDSKSKSREHIAFSYRGANKYLDIDPKKIISTKWIYLASFSGENWVGQLKNISKIVKDQKIKLAFNPGSKQLEAGVTKLKGILKLTEVLLVNRDEAIELALSQQHYNQAPHINTLLRELKKMGPKIVVVTDGDKGAYAHDGEEFFFMRSLKINPVDTTGAGDAFSSGFVAGMIKYREDIKKALELGVRNGASVAQKIGAQTGLIRK